MELLGSIAVTGATLLALFIVFCILAAPRSESAADSSPLLLERMLRRQGDPVARLALAAGDRSFAQAIRRCARCTHVAQCSAWLQSGACDGYQAFCPNQGFVHRMKLLSS